MQTHLALNCSFQMKQDDASPTPFTGKCRNFLVLYRLIMSRYLFHWAQKSLICAFGSSKMYLPSSTRNQTNANPAFLLDESSDPALLSGREPQRSDRTLEGRLWLTSSLERPRSGPSSALSILKILAADFPVPFSNLNHLINI